MAVYSITQIAGTLEQAERAVMGILADIADIPGVGEPEVITEKDGKVFLATATIVIPDDIQLDEVQREKLERYTNLDEKSEEFTADFEQAEEGEDQTPDDPIVAAAALNDRIKDMEPDLPPIDETSVVGQGSNQDAEGDIQVAENDIGDLLPDPAPEMQEETVLAAGASEDEEKDREREKVYAQKVDGQNLTQDKPSPDKMNNEKDPKAKQNNEPELA